MRKWIVILCGGLMVNYAAAQQHSEAVVLTMLRGKWVSTEDPVYIMQVYKDKIIQYNKGEDDSDYFSYTVTGIPCDTTIAQVSKTGFYLNQTSKDGLTTCSYIEAISHDSLSLNYNWGARLLHFRRKK